MILAKTKFSHSSHRFSHQQKKSHFGDKFREAKKKQKRFDNLRILVCALCKLCESGCLILLFVVLKCCVIIQTCDGARILDQWTSCVD